MTPKELMELAERLRLRRANEADENLAAAALRSYAELVSQIKFLADHSDLFDLWEEDDGYHVCEPSHPASVGYSTPEEALAFYAREIGWPGLEEL